MIESADNGSRVMGINSEKISKTISEIYEIADRLESLFDEAKSIMLNAEGYYVSESADKLFSNFDDFKTNFDIVIANVRTYGDDLTKVKDNFYNAFANAAIYFKKIGKEG